MTLTVPEDRTLDRPPERVAVVGGGLLGMTIALRLAQRGAAVTLLERDAQLGGLAQAWELGDIVWDRHYHVVVGADTTLRALLDELGLTSELIWTGARTGFFVGDRLAELTSTLDFLRFPTLNLIEKARLGTAILRAAAITDGEPLESITAREWLTQLCGARVYETIWRPLLLAKVGAAEPRVSAAFIWTIIRRLFGARSGGNKAERFGHVAGGYARIIAKLAERLAVAGVDVHLGAAVAKVEPVISGIAVVDCGGDAQVYDRCVITTPAPAAARLCPELPARENAALRAIEYQGIVCASLLLKKPLSPYYITNIADERLPFSAIIEMSAIVDPRELGGRHLVYLPKYAAPDHPIFSLDDDAVRELFVAGIQRIHPGFTPDTIDAFRLSRVPAVFPIPTLRYRERIPSITTSVHGLTIVNSAHILNGTLNVNETLDLAARALSELERGFAAAR